MTLYWDILDNGDLGVWYWEQDPQTDAPLATQPADGDGWAWGAGSKGLRNFPPDVLDLLFYAASDYYADTQTIDFTLFRFATEIACEQIERREQ